MTTVPTFDVTITKSNYHQFKETFDIIVNDRMQEEGVLQHVFRKKIPAYATASTTSTVNMQDGGGAEIESQIRDGDVLLGMNGHLLGEYGCYGTHCRNKCSFSFAILTTCNMIVKNILRDGSAVLTLRHPTVEELREENSRLRIELNALKQNQPPPTPREQQQQQQQQQQQDLHERLRIVETVAGNQKRFIDDVMFISEDFWCQLQNSIWDHLPHVEQNLATMRAREGGDEDESNNESNNGSNNNNPNE